MSKVMAASAMVLWGAGTAVTGAYAMGMFSGVDYEIPEKLEKFKSGEVEGCIKEVFSSIEGGKMGDGDGDLSSSFDTSSFTGNEAKGCLVVNWDKWKSNDAENKDKWRGNFRFLWSFAKGNKGFVVYTSASTSTKSESSNNEGEFSVEGIAYVLDKQSGSDVWKVGKKLEIASGRDKLAKDSWKDGSKLPKQNQSLPTGSSVNFDKDSFWNFLKADLDGSKLCAESECKDKGTSFRGYWSWKSPKEKQTKPKLGEWSTDLSKWWKEIYGDDKWNMNTLIQNIEGEWTERRLSSIPTV